MFLCRRVWREDFASCRYLTFAQSRVLDGFAQNKRKKKCWETDAISRRNIARLCFPFRPFPFARFLLFLLPSPTRFVFPSFAFLFVPLSPHRWIMLLWWAVVTLLNYICSQWSVIAIRLLTRERSRIDVSIRSASIVFFPLTVLVINMPINACYI